MNHPIPADMFREIEQTLVLAGRDDLADLLTEQPRRTPEETRYVELARNLADEELDFDDNPIVSASEHGAFVSAWIWIPAPEDSSVA